MNGLKSNEDNIKLKKEMGSEAFEKGLSHNYAALDKEEGDSLATPVLKNSLFLLLSRFFERLSYYGIRATLVLYLTGPVLAVPEEEVFQVYTWAFGIVVLGHIIGGVLGDFLVGHKWMTAVGGALQVIGAVLLCFPSVPIVYLGAALVMLGSGIFTPSFLARFGHLHLQNKRQLDAYFTLLIIVINIAAAIGGLVSSFVFQEHSLLFFLGTALVLLLSIAFSLLALTPSVAEVKPAVLSKPVVSRGMKVFAAGLLLTVFQLSYELIWSAQHEVLEKIGGTLFGFDSSTVMSFTISVSLLVFFVLWLIVPMKRRWKMMIGWFALLLGTGFLMASLVGGFAQTSALFVLYALLIGLAEAIIYPIGYAATVRNTHPKYLGSVFALILMVFWFSGTLLNWLRNSTYFDSEQGLVALLAGTLLVGFALGLCWLVYRLINRKTV